MERAEFAARMKAYTLPVIWTGVVVTIGVICSSRNEPVVDGSSDLTIIEGYGPVEHNPPLVVTNHKLRHQDHGLPSSEPHPNVYFYGAGPSDDVMDQTWISMHQVDDTGPWIYQRGSDAEVKIGGWCPWMEGHWVLFVDPTHYLGKDQPSVLLPCGRAPDGLLRWAGVMP
jgi:hypothetical protein